jgi:hypothetical protein
VGEGSLELIHLRVEPDGRSAEQEPGWRVVGVLGGHGIGKLKVQHRRDLPRVWVGENIGRIEVVYVKKVASIVLVAVMGNQLGQALTGHKLPSGVLYVVDEIPLGREAN